MFFSFFQRLLIPEKISKKISYTADEFYMYRQT